MKLIFKKEEDKEMSVSIIDGTSEKDFSYIEMIKALIIDNKFDESEFIGEISQKEKESITIMLEKINKAMEENIEE